MFPNIRLLASKLFPITLVRHDGFNLLIFFENRHHGKFKIKAKQACPVAEIHL